MFTLPFEIETTVTAEQGRIWIEQTQDGCEKQIVELTVHQFTEILNRKISIINAAWGEENEL